jgi:exonuclease III
MFHNAGEKTVWHDGEKGDLFDETIQALPDHDGYFAPAESDGWGLAIFVKKSLEINEVGDIFVFRHKDAMIGKDGTTLGKNMQYLKTLNNGQELNLLNLHGLWTGKGKTDTEERVSQSRRIIEFVKTLEGKIILAGDFNLLPDTESLKMIEKELNLKNLVKENNVESTRTSFYKKPDKHADYILVSSDIKVKNFQVLPEEISDHSALMLEF